jgi:hypothetical protein
MQALRAAGPRPVFRATGAGVVAALLALYVQLRGLLEVLDPVAPEMAQVGAGALIVFVAATLGGVVGAWQAALAGVRRRRDIVLVGAVGPGVACAVASLVLSVAVSVDPGRALLEVAVIAAGAAVGAWLLPAVLDEVRAIADEAARAMRAGRLDACPSRCSSRGCGARAARRPPSTWERSCSRR